jgi:hypothetical protein
MEKQEKQFLEITNHSGFLFQMAIENLIRSELKNEGFHVIASEHPWIDPRTNEEGFIDPIVEAGFAKFIIECKRPKGGRWFFLVPDSSNERNPYGRLTMVLKSSRQAKCLRC